MEKRSAMKKNRMSKRILRENAEFIIIASSLNGRFDEFITSQNFTPSRKRRKINSLKLNELFLAFPPEVYLPMAGG